MVCTSTSYQSGDILISTSYLTLICHHINFNNSLSTTSYQRPITLIYHLLSTTFYQQQSIDNILSILSTYQQHSINLSTTFYQQHSINSINLSTKFYQQHLLSIDNILSTSHHLDISPHQSTSYVIVIQYIYIHDSHSVYIHT